MFSSNAKCDFVTKICISYKHKSQFYTNIQQGQYHSPHLLLTDFPVGTRALGEFPPISRRSFGKKPKKTNFIILHPLQISIVQLGQHDPAWFSQRFLAAHGRLNKFWKFQKDFWSSGCHTSDLVCAMDLQLSKVILVDNHSSNFDHVLLVENHTLNFDGSYLPHTITQISTSHTYKKPYFETVNFRTSNFENHPSSTQPAQTIYWVPSQPVTLPHSLLSIDSFLLSSISFDQTSLYSNSHCFQTCFN